MKRYKVFKRFNNNNRYNKKMSFNKWSMYHGDDVAKLFAMMFENLRTINKNFLDTDNYEIILIEFMKHVYEKSDKREQ